MKKRDSGAGSDNILYSSYIQRSDSEILNDLHSEYKATALNALTQLGQTQTVLQILSEGKIKMALSVHKNLAEAQLAGAAKVGALVVGVFAVLIGPVTGGASWAVAASIIASVLGASAAALEEDWVGVATSIVSSAFAFKGYSPTSAIQKPIYDTGRQVAREFGDEGAQYIVGSGIGLGFQQVDDTLTGKASNMLSNVIAPPPSVLEQIIRDGSADEAFKTGADFLNPSVHSEMFEKHGAIREAK